MKFWFDTEFIEDGQTIDLISIGIVAEDGRTYYAENDECDLSRASDWVRENVLPHLVGGAVSKNRIATQIRQFLGDDPEIWGYYADYDWVLLCQLYGRMIDLPPTWPKFCLDVRQLAYMRGYPALPKQDGAEHHALEDAWWTRRAWEFLMAPATPSGNFLTFNHRALLALHGPRPVA